jgi:hypothetical protein
MLVHLLGLLDLLGAISLVLGHYGVIHFVMLYTAVYFFAKLAFFHDWLSWIDTAAGIYAVFLFFGAASSLTWFFVAYFLYKTSVWLFYALSH